MGTLRRRVGKVALLIVAVAAVGVLYTWSMGVLERKLTPSMVAEDRASEQLQKAPDGMASFVQRHRAIFTVDSTPAQIARDLAREFFPKPYRLTVHDGSAGLSVASFAKGYGGGFGATERTVRMCAHYEVDLRSGAVTPSGESCPPDAPRGDPRLGTADKTIEYEPDPDSPATPPPTPPGAADLGVPPNHVDNNSWKQRRDPTPADQATAEAATKPLREALERQRRTGAVDPATTQSTVRKLGYPDERAYVKPWGDPDAPVGTIVAIHVGDTACLIATIRPEGVQVTVHGMNPEFHFSCLQPRTH